MFVKGLSVKINRIAGVNFFPIYYTALTKCNSNFWKFIAALIKKQNKKQFHYSLFYSTLLSLLLYGSVLVAHAC